MRLLFVGFKVNVVGLSFFLSSGAWFPHKYLSQIFFLWSSERSGPTISFIKWRTVSALLSLYTHLRTHVYNSSFVSCNKSLISKSLSQEFLSLGSWLIETYSTSKKQSCFSSQMKGLVSTSISNVHVHRFESCQYTTHVCHLNNYK